MAIRQGDDFQSFYYLAEIAAMSSKPEEQCPSMVAFYKHVAERGDWDSEVWWEAERAFARGDEKIAFLGYWMMAERGYEVAQNNVAWILDRGQSLPSRSRPKLTLRRTDKKRLRIPYLDKTEVSSNVTDRIALTYWTRSAAQDNVDALLKTGDYYYAGLGSAGGESVPELQKAASFYRSAANSHTSAMAMWNLGWLHETGRGVTQVRPSLFTRCRDRTEPSRRTFILRNDTTIKLSKLVSTPISPSLSPSSRSDCVRSITPSSSPPLPNRPNRYLFSDPLRRFPPSTFLNRLQNSETLRERSARPGRVSDRSGETCSIAGVLASWKVVKERAGILRPKRRERLRGTTIWLPIGRGGIATIRRKSFTISKGTKGI